MKYIFLGIIFSVISWGAEYIVPPEFDNTVLATESSQRILISNTTSPLLWSNGLRTIGGKTVRYRCVTIPKIQCRGKSARIVVNTSEISLRDKSVNKLVNIYTYDVIAESSGKTSWKVCGGAVGGTTWDNTSLTSYKSGADTILRFTYDENAVQDIAYFFTNRPTQEIGGANSFMVIETKQVCGV